MIRALLSLFRRPPLRYGDSVEVLDASNVNGRLAKGKIYVVRECERVDDEWLVELQGLYGRFRSVRFRRVRI